MQYTVFSLSPLAFHFKRTHTHKLAVAFSLMFLGACSSIKQPEATVPLVSEKAISSKFQIVEMDENLFTLEENMGIRMSGTTFTAGKSYFSAAGNECRVFNGQSIRKLICKTPDEQVVFEVDQVLSDFYERTDAND
uniref:hypothetical protein n=1 Tax=Ningiella ruwaisensis TaxID=2364274 RepID=UPI00109F7666|nr:hypothetical protein [Ningiella ruwaisensis]